MTLNRIWRVEAIQPTGGAENVSKVVVFVGRRSRAAGREGADDGVFSDSGPGTMRLQAIRWCRFGATPRADLCGRCYRRAAADGGDARSHEQGI